jgi:hypothetical protein
MSSKQVEEFYATLTTDHLEEVPFQTILDISKLVSKEIEEYKHNDF